MEERIGTMPLELLPPPPPEDEAGLAGLAEGAADAGRLAVLLLAMLLEALIAVLINGAKKDSIPNPPGILIPSSSFSATIAA
jgi:hypothetical protein